MLRCVNKLAPDLQHVLLFTEVAALAHVEYLHKVLRV